MLEFFTTYIAPCIQVIGQMAAVGFYVSLIILLVRLFADKKISPSWKYCMWILALIALIIPYRPQSNIAFFKSVDEPSEVSILNEYYDAARNTSDFTDVYPQNAIEQRNDLTRQYNGLMQQERLRYALVLVANVILPIVYITGFILLVLYAVSMNRRLNRKVLEYQCYLPEKYLQMFEHCKQDLSIKTDVRLILQEHVNFPALIGFRPKVILPLYTLEMDDESVEYILYHELSHYKRGDFIVNYILVALKALYWWNPLTWLMFKYVRQDMETANDAFILKKLGKDIYKPYSLSLTEVLAKHSKIPFAPKMLCMADDKKNMKRRINMLILQGEFARRKVLIGIASVLLMFGIGVLFLTTGVRSEIRVPFDYVEYYASWTEEGYMMTDNFLYKEVDGHIEIVRIFGAEHVVIPETIDGKPVTTIRDLAFEKAYEYNWGQSPYTGGYEQKSVYLSKSITQLSSGIYYGSRGFDGARSLQEIIVDPDNPYYSSIDGVLYTKDGTKLLVCPAAKSGILVIPEGMTSWNADFCDSSFTYVVFPSTLKSYGGFGSCDSLTDIEVSPDNPYMTSFDGIIYSKDMSTILFCPRGREATVFIPEGVRKIDSYAFGRGWHRRGSSIWPKNQSVYVPESVTEISKGAFDINYGTIYITGYRGSAIEQYVRTHYYLQFIPIDDLVSE